jgi:tRNA G18 (ribose-2'-O)-methylase SpoU
MNIVYHPSIKDFVASVGGKTIIGIENSENSQPLAQTEFPQEAVLVFGSEGSGLSEEMINMCEKLVAIEQFGSTRSVNVGVASGVAMYAWLQQHVL